MTSDADGTPVLIKQLGEVRIGPALRFGAVTKHGEGEIVAGDRDDADRRQLARGRPRGEGAARRDPAGAARRASRSARTTTAPSSSSRMLKTVAINLAEGALLVALVLFLTLGSFRGALIAALAIPLSMGVALIGMVRMRRHRQPDVAGRDRLRPAGRRRDRHAGGGARRDRAAQGADARGRRVPGRAVDEQGGAAGRRSRC